MFARMLLVWLLVMNLGVLAWWVLHRPEQAESGARVDEAIPRLQLLEEAGSLPLPEASDAAPAAETVLQAEDTIAQTPVESEGRPVCASFGPFVDETQANAAAERLRAANASSKLRQVTSTSRSFDVQLPSQGSADAARAMAAKLREAGFRDLMVISQGENQNGIALGRFGSEENARRHQSALQAKGFNAQILSAGGSTQFWLDVEAAAGFDSSRWRREINAQRVQNRRC